MEKQKTGGSDQKREISLPVYGEDSEGRRKRGFDWVVDHGRLYIESVNRDGRKIKTPASAALATLRQLHLKEKPPEDKQKE